MVDLSHSGEKTCLEAARVSKQPISINHTGCRALVDLPRNKTDEELKLVADKGGFIGIYFMPFLAKNGAVTADDVVAHIEHAVNDLRRRHGRHRYRRHDDADRRSRCLPRGARAHERGAPQGRRRRAGRRPATLPLAVDLRGANQYFELAARLEKRGHTPARIEKILGGNFLRYAKAVWQ